MEHGKVAGPLTISDDYQMHGIVEGNATVARDGFLHLFGMVTGDLVVEEGASAEVRGTVSKSVFNAGNLEVFGVVSGRLTSTPDASTTIAPGAVINGTTH
jgi:cytoskeletal protein CcmA (bactofilin family)